MPEPQLVVRRDVEIGGWIAPRLGPFGGYVGSIVPRGFAAYARILHPIQTPDRLWRWADIAEATGRIVHPTAQWHRVANRDYDDGDYSDAAYGNPPDWGCLDPASQLALIEVLRRHSAPDADWQLGIWEGWSWLSPGRNIITAHLDGSAAADPPPDPGPPFGPDALSGPLLRHPHRNYLLLSGPPEAVPTLGHRPTPDWFIPATPNLMWLPDRSWCVASEIDFDSTLVGGTEDLIADILAAPDLEAWPVDPDDDLTIHGDQINT